jgi:hypothetical protein
VALTTPFLLYKRLIMKIKIIRGTVVKGVAYENGNVVDTDQETGLLLIGLGKAQEVKPEDKTEPKKKERKLFRR